MHRKLCKVTQDEGEEILKSVIIYYMCVGLGLICHRCCRRGAYLERSLGPSGAEWVGRDITSHSFPYGLGASRPLYSGISIDILRAFRM